MRHLRKMREVESQPVGSDQGAGLLDVISQNAAQGRMQDMGGGVVELDRLSRRCIDHEGNGVALGEAAGKHPAPVDDDAGRVFARGRYLHPSPGAHDAADVTGLTAGLGIEGSAVRDHFHLAAGLRSGSLLLVHHHQQHLRLGRQQVVAHKVRLEPAGRQALVGVADAGEGRHRAGLGPLALHLPVEAVHVERQAFVAHHVPYDVRRKAVGVVELEEDRPRHFGPAAGLELGEGLVQQLQPGVQGVPEALLLVGDDGGDEGLGFAQLGIGRPHDVADHPRGLVQKGPVQPDVAAVADRAAHDAPQDIASAFVGRQDAVPDQKHRGPAVVRDHLHGDVRGLAPAERHPGHLLGPPDDRPDEVGVEIRADVLNDGGDALQPHAGVDAGFGQRRHEAGGIAVELHEHQVPDLQEPVAVAAHGALGPPAAVGCAAVDDDLGAGPAGAGVAHGPEVVLLSEAHDAVVRQTHRAAPQLVGLLVVEIDRRIELVRRQPVAVGEQVPGQDDGALLEVIPEGEVPQHLEEGVVARGVSDVLQVVVLAARPHALLGGRGPKVVALLLPQEHAFELHHAGVDEQQGRVVVRHQRRAAHHLMAVLFEIVEKLAACLVAGHRITPPPALPCPSPRAPGPRGSCRRSRRRSPGGRSGTV